MKYCSKCGAEIEDDAVVCVHCGCKVEEEKKNKNNSTLDTLIKVFMILDTVILGCALIPLAWCIPMTVSVCKSIKNGTPISTALKVCALLFVGVIPGILLLVRQDEE